MIKHLIPTVLVAILSVGVAHAASPLTGAWTLTAADTMYADGHGVHGFGVIQRAA